MRVLTYNIRGGLGLDGKRSIERIASVAAEHKPDLICWQEVHQRTPWGGWTDQPKSLEQILQMPTVFQRTVQLGWGGEGIAISVSSPIISVTRHRLPCGREPRGVLEVICETLLGKLSVFCTHWGLTRDERLRQAQDVGRWIAKAESPVLLCGDLNENSSGAAVGLLLSKTGLLDAGARSDLPTYPADVPRARIDYVLHSPGLTAANVEIISTSASDHCPLLVDFALTHPHENTT